MFVLLSFSRYYKYVKPRPDEMQLAPRRSFGGGRPAAERWREALADALAVVASELTLGATAVGCQYAIAARRRDA